MANEIQVSAALSCTNGNFVLPTIGGGVTSVTQSTLGGGGPGYLSIGTSEEVVAFTDIGTLGYCYIKNLDTTNYVTFGPESGAAMVAVGRLKAGESCVLRLEPGITFRMKANTAAVKVQIICLEN